MAIQIRRGSNAEWEVNNSNIVVGEPAVATDSKRAFIGTASGAYMELANIEAIAPAYDPGNSYMVDDYVSYQGKLYVCTVPTSGAWNASCWQVTSIGQALAENAYSNFETQTMSGDIVSFPNGAGGIPVKDLKADVVAVQDLHGYDNPWVGGAGKNLVNVNSPQTITSQTLLATYVTSEQISFTYSATVKNNASVEVRIQIIAYNGGTIIKQKYTPIPTGGDGRYSVTLDLAGETYDRITLIVNGTAVGYNLTISDVQLEKGSTATDYAPYENICPISGWDEVNVNVAGKNLVESIKAAFVSPSIDYAEYTEAISGTVLAFKCVAGQTYTISGVNGNRLIYAIYDSMPTSGEHSTYFENLSSGITFPKTITPQKTGVCVVAVANAQIDSSKAQIELGSTATAYEPYNGQTYTIDLDGTRYGGTLDVTTGVLTVTHGYVELGTLTWLKITNTTYGDFFRSAYGSVSAKTNSAVICSQYNSSTLWFIRNTNVDKAVGVEGGYVEIRDLLYTDATSFKNALTANNAQLVYELATPQTVQLTPTQVRTLLGQNNIWADSGEVEVTYRISNVQ